MLTKICIELEIPVSIVFHGRGTAIKSMLDLLGIGLHSIDDLPEREMRKIKVLDVLSAHLSTICHVVILLRGVYSVWGREEEQRESI